MKIAIDTNIIVSHLRGDEFAEDTRKFFAWARANKQTLMISEVVYAELYAGIHLSSEPHLEEKRIQRFLAVNNIEVRLSKTLGVAKRAGQIYAKYLTITAGERKRILPDFLIGSHAELYGEILATWNPRDFIEYLKIPALTPNQLIERRRATSGQQHSV